MTAAPIAVGVDPGDVEAARLIAAHRDARGFYRYHLLHTDGPRRYLTERGLGVLTRPDLPWSHGVDAPWHLGYAPSGWTDLVKYLHRLGYTTAEMTAAGLATHTRTGRLVDTFRDRIMFPIHNPDGDPIAFIARAAPGAPADTPKYRNSPDTAIYHKGQILYGFGEQRAYIDDEWAPVLVEGPVDVLAVWLARPATGGVGRMALAACGTSLSAHHAATVCSLPGAARHGITTAYDNDPAGIKATHASWRQLSRPAGIDLYAATLPAGLDPADLVASGETAHLRAALTHQARPLAQAVIDGHLDELINRHPDLLHHVEGRVGATRALAALLTDLPPTQIVTLAPYLAARTGTNLDTVSAVIIDALEKAHAPGRTRTDVRADSPSGSPTGITEHTASRNPPARRGGVFPPPGAPGVTAEPASGSYPEPGSASRARRR